MFTHRQLTIALVSIATLLAATASVVHADPVGGPQSAVHQVDAYSTDVFVVSFYGDEPAAVAVVGDGDTDLDLYVYDENGYLIGSDTDSTDRCLVLFRPRWTGQFRIEVRNLGSVYNEYRIRAW
jgi:hypothetical protein